MGFLRFQDAYVTFGDVTVDRLRERLFDALLLERAPRQSHRGKNNCDFLLHGLHPLSQLFFLSPLFVRFMRISGGVRLPVSSKSVQRSTLLTERFLRPLFQRLPSADAPSLAVPMETTTRKKGKATDNVTASTKIPVK
jgi:hypothetical protein